MFDTPGDRARMSHQCDCMLLSLARVSWVITRVATTLASSRSLAGDGFLVFVALVSSWLADKVLQKRSIVPQAFSTAHSIILALQVCWGTGRHSQVLTEEDGKVSASTGPGVAF